MALSATQDLVAKDNHRFRVVIAGRRWGKTHLSIRELAKFASKPNQKVMYVAPSYRMAKAIVWDKLKYKLIDLRWVKKINESDLTITLINETKISIRGADNFDSLRGLENHFVVLDEFAMIDQRAWTEVLRATLSNTLGHALFISTPTGKNNWAFDMFNKHQDDDSNWSSHQYTSIQGGQIPETEIEQAKKDLDQRVFRQEFEASFESYDGTVCWAWNRNENIKSIAEPDTRILHIGIDFNVSPITAAIFVRNGDDMYQIDEVVMHNSNTFELVEEIQNRYPVSKVFAYPDPAGNQRKTSAGGNTDIKILSNAGFNVKAPRAHNLVKDRINDFNSRLCSSDGQRHLFVGGNCKHTIESIEKFAYKAGTQVPDKDQGWDHMFDAASYAIDFLFPITRAFERDPYAPQVWRHQLAVSA
jgi:phage terminase large subunit